MNGTPASAGEYPAQGFLEGYRTPGDPLPLFTCGGTMVGSRQFLTAALCTFDSAGLALPAANFRLYLGVLDLTDASPADRYAISAVSVHPSYSSATLANNVAVLTLDRVASNDRPTRVVTAAESGLWAPDVSATVIGWGGDL